MLTRLVRAEGIGELPDVLAPTSGWRPQIEDEALDGQLREECARLGWLDQRGRLDVDVAAALAVLCRPTTEFFGWVTVEETKAGVLAGAIGRLALVAVHMDGWVSMRSTRLESLAQMLVAQIPNIAAGQSRPFTVRRSDLLAFGGNQQPAHGGVAVRPVPWEVRQLHHIAGAPRAGAGEFYVAIRDGVGRRQVIADPICCVDTAAGRYVTVTTVVGGEAEMLVAPANSRDLVARLHEARSSLGW
jgi:hypothetical protein